MDRIVRGFDVGTYTDAPLRADCLALLEAPPVRIFEVISNHTKLFLWLPLVSDSTVSRRHALQRDGVSTVRWLHLGAFTVQEYIVASNPPHLLASSIEESEFIIDHVALQSLSAERHGGTWLRWRAWFRTTTLAPLSAPLAGQAMTLLFRGALGNLIREFGGRPGGHGEKGTAL
ncbi:MAG: SRPBCC family protein [Anaerolineaceae bacterium]|nr:SRPBCC family protein [Anaerolineaceae bacterium]